MDPIHSWLQIRTLWGCVQIPPRLRSRCRTWNLNFWVWLQAWQFLRSCFLVIRMRSPLRSLSKDGKIMLSVCDLHPPRGKGKFKRLFPGVMPSVKGNTKHPLSSCHLCQHLCSFLTFRVGLSRSKQNQSPILRWKKLFYLPPRMSYRVTSVHNQFIRSQTGTLAVSDKNEFCLFAMPTKAKGWSRSRDKKILMKLGCGGAGL